MVNDDLKVITTFFLIVVYKMFHYFVKKHPKNRSFSFELNYRQTSLLSRMNGSAVVSPFSPQEKSPVQPQTPNPAPAQTQQQQHNTTSKRQRQKKGEYYKKLEEENLALKSAIREFEQKISTLDAQNVTLMTQLKFFQTCFPQTKENPQ